jgi:hypothetical protein
MGNVSKIGNNAILSVTGSVVGSSVGAGGGGVAWAQAPKIRLTSKRRETLINVTTHQLF